MRTSGTLTRQPTTSKKGRQPLLLLPVYCIDPIPPNGGGRRKKERPRSGSSAQLWLAESSQIPVFSLLGWASRIYTDLFAQIPKDQWMVSVTWLTRSFDRPLEFAVSDAPHARYIGIRDSAVRGVIGHFGADVTAAAGKCTISAEFYSRIRKRNLYLYAFS